MKRFALVTLMGACLAVSASAVEVGLLLDQQVGKDQDIRFLTSSATTPNLYTSDAFKATGLGIRVAVPVVDFKTADIAIAATYHPKSTGDLNFTSKITGDTSPLVKGKLSSEYFALGVQASWKAFVDLHLGLDLRRETITVSDVAGNPKNLNDSSTLTRPWIKGGVGFSIPAPVNPFLRLELAMAVKNDGDASGNAEEIRKALAPRYQMGLYGGVRF